MSRLFALSGLLFLPGCVEAEPQARSVGLGDGAGEIDRAVAELSTHAPPATKVEEPTIVGCGDETPPPVVDLSWKTLGGAPTLKLSLRDDIVQEVAVELSYILIAGGSFHQAPLDALLLSPQHPTHEFEIAVSALAPPVLNLAKITLSGHFYVAAVVTDSEGKYLGRRSAPPMYFHPDGGALITYGGDDLEQIHGGGDFAGLRPKPAVEGERQLGWIAGGFGLPPEVVAQTQLEDPGE